MATVVRGWLPGGLKVKNGFTFIAGVQRMAVRDVTEMSLYCLLYLASDTLAKGWEDENKEIMMSWKPKSRLVISSEHGYSIWK